MVRKLIAEKASKDSNGILNVPKTKGYGVVQVAPVKQSALPVGIIPWYKSEWYKATKPPATLRGSEYEETLGSRVSRPTIKIGTSGNIAIL